MKLNSQVLRIFRSSAWSRAWRSLAAFLLGLLLAFIYGAIALYIQKHALWYCIITTVTMAAFTAFGMGLAVSVRTNITLMLPMLCSSKYPFHHLGLCLKELTSYTVALNSMWLSILCILFGLYNNYLHCLLGSMTNPFCLITFIKLFIKPIEYFWSSLLMCLFYLWRGR